MSPLQFDGARLCRLVIDAQPCEKVLADSLGFDLGFEFGFENLGPRAYRVRLGVKAKGRRSPRGRELATIEAVAEGSFSASQEVPQSVIDQLVPLNCYAMLYGVLRGVVAQATALTAYGCIWLPSVNFVAVLQEAEKAQRGKRKPTAKAKALPTKSPASKGTPSPVH